MSKANLETDICTYYRLNDTTVVVELLPQAVITIQAVQNVYAKADSLMTRRPYLVLLDTSGHHTWNIPVEVLKYMARNPYQKDETAFAIVVNSLAMRLIANHFVKYYQPLIPTRVFTKRDKALTWLHRIGK